MFIIILHVAQISCKIILLILPISDLVGVTAATGAKNQRHESRTDEVVYLYSRTCSA